MAFPAFPGPYATQADLAGYWRPLSTAEQSRATVLLGAAADRINELPNANNFVTSACHWVSLDACRRIMIPGTDHEDLKSLSQGLPGISVTQQFTNAAELVITPAEINRLRGRVGQAAGSVVLSSNVRIPRDPWNFQPSVQWGYQTGSVQWMRLMPNTAALTVGAELHLTVLAATFFEYEDRTAYTLFTTSAPTVARVDNVGMITAIAVGTATITATYEGFSDTCVVTVA